MSIDLTLYAIARTLHVAVGGLAAFVAFPLAVCSGKGTAFHRKAGYAAALLCLLVAVTGAGMLINPLFHALWLRNEQVMGTEWGLFFNELLYEPLFFLWLDVLLIYFCGSAIRVWMRVASVKRGGPSFGMADVALAAVMMAGSCYMLFVGCWDLWHLSFHPFAFLFAELALYTLLFGIVDVISFLAPPRHLVEWGFALHGYKFFSAWDGLMTAFIIRLRIGYGTFKALDSLYSLAAHALILILLWRWFASMKAAQTAAAKSARFPDPQRDPR